MNLSRNISPSDSDDTPRPPPKWVYPEGEGDIPEESENKAWKAWNAAIDNDAPLEERDAKAETDFWRSAAKEIGDDQTSPSNQPDQTFQPPDDDILTNEPTKSSDVWQMARGVTGEMSELQEKLRSELERYNPDENTDQYRDIARELVGPPEEPWENTDPKRSSKADAEAGTGWNPDVDWMRFDDVRREQVKKAEQAARMEAQRVAREDLETAGDESQQNFSAVDDELTKTYTDQSVDESFINNASMSSLPGFLTSRMRRSGTYGGGWSGAEEEAQKLVEQGVPLRDPKADAEQWRGVARELNIDVKVDGETVITTDDQLSPEPESEADMDDLATQLENTRLAEEDGQTSAETTTTDEESSWSSWRSGAAKWEAASEKMEERDAAKEVDMWRSSAREFASGTPTPEPTGVETKPASEMAKMNNPPDSEGAIWDQWRSANTQWESSISAASEEVQPFNETTWSGSTESDWGAGLGGKAVSERSAWEQWNTVSDMGKTSDSSLWWKTRVDSSFETEGMPDRSVNNTDEWRNIAREALNIPEKKVSEEPVSREERIEKDCTLDSWRSIAKDLIEDQD